MARKGLVDRPTLNSKQTKIKMRSLSTDLDQQTDPATRTREFVHLDFDVGRRRALHPSVPHRNSADGHGSNLSNATDSMAL